MLAENNDYIETLLAMGDIVEIGRARAFLRALADACPNDVRGVALAIARRIMSVPDWHEKMEISQVVDFVVERRDVFHSLWEMADSQAYDPMAEFVVGCTVVFARRAGLASPWA